MISGIFGLPGSGKSLFLSYLADRAIKGKSINLAGCNFQSFRHYDRIYTNFPFAGAYELDFDLLGKVDMGSSLILCDEIMMFCDSRNFKTFGENLKFFFSQHRKMGIDFVYASQAYNDCDLKIRNLTHSFYYIEKAFFTFSVVKPIRASFTVDHDKILQGYRYASPWSNYYFDRRSMYALNDTNYLIAKNPIQQYDPVPWGTG